MSSPAQPRPDRYRRGSGLPRWAKVVLVLVAVLLVGVLAVIGLFVWAFSGGWDGLRGTASPSDAKVVAAREHSGGELDRLTEGTLRTIGPARELARIRTDSCRSGQNNWKIHDGYTLRCERSDAVVLVPPDADVSAAGRRLSAALTAAGWHVPGGRDELTAPAEPNHSFLDATRRGQLTRTDDDRLLLDLGVTSRGTSPVSGDVPYDPDATVEGDVTAYREALRGGGPDGAGLRLVVRTTVRYFEDS
jgi:hypothetical protein